MKSSPAYSFCAVVFVALMMGISACDRAPADTLGSGVSYGNGSLRIDITGDPFTYEGVTHARLTITKIEILPAGATGCGEICDDGFFCNGLEQCVDAQCRMGIAPCLNDEACNEEIDTCVRRCDTDDECDDGAFCNGQESCIGGLCAEGTWPCGGGTECDEEAEICVASDAIVTVDAGASMGVVADNADDSEAAGDSYLAIFEGQKQIDLLNLANETSEILNYAVLPAGSYSAIRVHVASGEITLMDGRVFDLRPAGEGSVTLHSEIAVVDSAETLLVLGMDAEQVFEAEWSEDESGVEGIIGYELDLSGMSLSQE